MKKTVFLTVKIKLSSDEFPLSDENIVDVMDDIDYEFSLASHHSKDLKILGTEITEYFFLENGEKRHL